MNVKWSKNFLATRAKLAEHPVEKVGANLRAMMPWKLRRNWLIAIKINYFFYKYFAISNIDCIIVSKIY